jgi:hypothetical protein
VFTTSVVKRSTNRSTAPKGGGGTGRDVYWRPSVPLVAGASVTRVRSCTYVVSRIAEGRVVFSLPFDRRFYVGRSIFIY